MLETDLNKQDEYNRCNNLDIQRIPGSVPGNQLELKVIEIFHQVNVKINMSDLEDGHHMGKSKKTTMVCFVNIQDSSGKKS